MAISPPAILARRCGQFDSCRDRYREFRLFHLALPIHVIGMRLSDWLLDTPSNSTFASCPSLLYSLTAIPFFLTTPGFTCPALIESLLASCISTYILWASMNGAFFWKMPSAIVSRRYWSTKSPIYPDAARRLLAAHVMLQSLK